MNSPTQFKKTPILPLLIALGLVALASPPVARADAVTDWNLIASNTIITNPGQPPLLGAAGVLGFAMVQGAVYDGVNAIDRGHQPYLAQPDADPRDSKEAAAATASYQVLIGLFPAQQPTLEPIYNNYMAVLPDDPPGSKAAGITIGEATAAAMLEARQGDGRFGPPPTLYPPAPGIWRPTPPNFAPDPAPWVGNVLPTRRTSTRSRSSAHSPAQPERRTRPMLRSSGKTMASRFGTGSFAPWPPARP
jgi:hypothetical protein